MKKLLLLILLLPLFVLGQENVRRSANHYYGNGDPSGNSVTRFPSLSLNCTYINQVTGKVFKYTNTGATKWVQDNTLYPAGGSGSNGTNGKDATVTINSVNTVTGSAGSQANVTITDLNPSPSDANLSFMFTIPKGDKGDTGASGSGSGGSFPFTVVIAASGDDRAAIQAAINKNATDNIPVYLIGNFDISGEITVNKTNYRLTMFMYGAKITASNQNAFTFFKRTMPTDNSDANIYINATFMLYGGELSGYPSQNGWDMGASYMSRYQDMSGQGLNEFIHLRFALNTTVENCKGTECINPFIADIGNWPGADNANSQSNHSTFNHCKAYMPSNGNIAFYSFACSGIVISQSIVEGFKCNYGIVFDANKSNVVRDGTIEGVHMECVNGATGAFIKLNYSAGVITINKIYGQYPCLLLDASGGEFTFVRVSNVPWFRVSSAGKLIKRTGDIQLLINEVIVEGPTIIKGSNVMSYIDNGSTTYRTPYYFEDPTGGLKINNQR